MNINHRLSIVCIITVLTLLGAGYAVPTRTPTTKNFSIGDDYGARATFSFNIRESGCIWAKATWTGTASNLSLILNGPDDQAPAYNRQDGTSDLVLAYSVKADDLKSGISWTITIANFGGGTASGEITIEIPPTQVPCEVEALPGKSPGQIMLSWNYTGKELPAFFLVERSTDDQIWDIVVSSCKLRPSGLQTSYSCSDNSGLKSKALYYYRACSVPSASAGGCGTLNVSPPVLVKAP
ncbi:MAG: hypothetical protein HYR94_03130 [Chloroflexi bacterium]|nr:hypothetical protein [Chloroflexota bacterium]